MSPHLEPSNEVRLPGVDPLRPCSATFSTQRYEPRLRPPPLVHVNTRSRRIAHEAQGLHVPALHGSFDAVHSSSFAGTSRVGDAAFEQNGWIQKFRRLYENLANYSVTTRRRIVNGFTSVWMCIRCGFGSLRDSKMSMTGSRTKELVTDADIPKARVEINNGR